jgi:Tfp pilus assembly protein PilV
MHGMRPKTRRAGFSLVETAVATVMVGLGIVALVTSLGAGSRVNAAGRDLTKAVYLAQEMREWTLRLPFKDPDAGDANNPPGPDGSDPHVFVDDLDDFYASGGLVFSPPRDGTGQSISDMTGWSQKVTLTWRNAANFSQVVTPGSSTVINVQVSILFQGKEVFATNWLVAKRT